MGNKGINNKYQVPLPLSGCTYSIIDNMLKWFHREIICVSESMVVSVTEKTFYNI